MAKRNNQSAPLSARGPLSRKVLTGARAHRMGKVVDIEAWKEGRELAKAFERSGVVRGGLEDRDPLHRLFILGQNQLSVLVEQLSVLPELSKLSDVIVEAEEEYLPDGPPMSPLTRSYFFCWMALDLVAGPQRESFASIVVDLCRFFRAAPSLIELFDGLDRSRMGIYLHTGFDGKYIVLRELVTGDVRRVSCPAGHKGGPGELWYARIFDWPFSTDGPGYSVVVTTPYVLASADANGRICPAKEQDWLAFFERTLPKTGKPDRAEAYAYLMKYGLNRNYWNEYVFLAYVNDFREMIMLEGIPDRPGTLPHRDLAR